MESLYIYLAIYVALLIGISYYFSRKQKQEDFLIAGRNRGTWQILLSNFAAYIGAGYFITYTGFSYEYGFGVFAMLLGMFAGFLLFGLWAGPKIHPVSKEKKFYKIGDIVYLKTQNKFAANLANWVANVMLVAWTIVGTIGGAKIITEFGLMSYESAVFLTVFVVLAYILLAGFRAILLTDAIQAFVIIVLLALVTYGIINGTSVASLIGANTQSADLMTAISFFIFGMLSLFSYSNMYQLVFASNNKSVVKKSMIYSLLPIILVGFLLLAIGLFMSTHAPGIDSGLVFTSALRNFLPEYLLPFSIVLFFAGIMSSIDTNVYAISSHYAIGKKGNNITRIRLSVGVLILFILVVTMLFRDLVNMSIIAGGLSVTLSFPMIYLIAGGNSYKKFIASVIFGLFAMVIGIAIFGINPALALPVIILSALGLLWKK